MCFGGLHAWFLRRVKHTDFGQLRFYISWHFTFDDDGVDNDNCRDDDDEGGVWLEVVGDDPPGRKGGRFWFNLDKETLQW